MITHVTILGAGVVGLNIALTCARRGMTVTVIDRSPQQRDGCSFGNAGLVSPSHFIPLAAPGMITLGLKWMLDPDSPFYIKPSLDPELLTWGTKFWLAATNSRVRAAAPVLRDLSLLSRQCYDEIGFDIGLVKNGLLALCRSQRTLDEEAHVAEHAREIGIAAEVLDARATAAKDPGVTMDVAGAVYFPQDCHLSPSHLIAALECELLKLGVQFLWETEVRGLRVERASIRAVQTAQGEIAGDEFVLASGVWSAELARLLGLKIPMQAGKGYSLTIMKPRQLPALPSICTEGRLAVTPMNDSLRMAGTMELAGINTSINKRRVEAIRRSFRTFFPAFEEGDLATIEPWAGLRPVSPDGMPYIGRTRAVKNLCVATGHSMLGVSLGAATGQIVAACIAGEMSSVSLDLVSPDRFA